MASTNFKIFDENGTNMLSDGNYAADTQRTGGVQGGIASSQLQNKFQHQMSYMAKAIADMLVNKGIDINDTENYANFAAKVAQGIDNITYGTTEPTSATPCSKVGQFYLWDKGNMFFELYMCISLNPTRWFFVKDISTRVKTEVITTDSSWVAPKSLDQSFSVYVVGSGGSGYSASGAVLKKWTGTIPQGTTVPVTIGLPVSNANGQITSFGSYVSASGGTAVTNTTRVAASAISDGGMGGGGSAGAGPGGNGGTYGGGGGGASVNSYPAGAGGNGGTYGGGGGGGGGLYGGTPQSGGSGGTYGGRGGNSGAGYIGDPSYVEAQDGSYGTNTIGLGLDFEGYGLPGLKSPDPTHGNPGGGGGGGGYGGNGGTGYFYFYGNAVVNNQGLGGGGGGYGGNGGNARYARAGGGGGYGGNGGAADYASDWIDGGGYGPDNYGAGTYYSHNSKQGICIISYRTME